MILWIGRIPGFDLPAVERKQRQRMPTEYPTLSCYSMTLHDIDSEKVAIFLPEITLHDPA